MQLLDALGMLGGEVVLFTHVLGQVKKVDLSIARTIAARVFAECSPDALQYSIIKNYCGRWCCGLQHASWVNTSLQRAAKI